ncbi:uncharacterized protein ACNLHF_021529 [Anomaloglossus baeobatrachus]
MAGREYRGPCDTWVAMQFYPVRGQHQRDVPVLFSHRTVNKKTPDVPQDHQGEDLPHINIIETYVRGDERCKEEIPTYDYPDNCTRSSDVLLIFSNYKADDRFITPDTYEEHAVIPNISPSFNSKDLASDISSSSLQTVNQNNNKLDFEQQSAHTRKRSFSCLECGKCFTRKLSLVRHQGRHTGEKPYSCSECGKCFTIKSDLVRHQNHTGKKSFSCLECGKCFTRKLSLVRHQGIHTGEKPYSCSECGKCFTIKADVVRHQKAHTGEKPFSCPQCGKCFTWKPDLVKHKKIHTGEKPFSCLDCGRRFIEKSALTKHRRTHTGERPFSCPECGIHYSYKSTLSKHLITHRGENTSLC